MRIEKNWDRLLQIHTIGRDDTNADQYHHPYEPTPYAVLERLVESGFFSEQDVVLEVVFAAVPEETTEPDPTEPEPTDPSEPEPTEPVKTYNLDLRTNGNGKFSYVDGKTSAAPGESIFFYAVPNPGYQLTNVGVFNPKNEIDVSQIRLYEQGNDLYELIMIDHELIMTLYFTPIG